MNAERKDLPSQMFLGPQASLCATRFGHQLLLFEFAYCKKAKVGSQQLAFGSKTADIASRKLVAGQP